MTGIGIYSCIGKNVQEVTESLRAGRSGIGIDAERTKYGYRSPLTGILEEPVLKGLLDRHQRNGLAQEGKYAYMASVEALKSAKIDADYLDANEVGIIYGNDSSAKPVIEAHKVIEEKHDTMLLGSAAIFQSMNSTVTMNLASIFHLRGINFTVSAACASGSHSVGLSYLFIRDGLQDMVMVGGAQEVNLYSMASFDALSAFSIRTDDPTKASRPFDAHRDGLVPSGGAATLILEEYEHAVRRGAHIYGEVIGYGFSSNGNHISQPNDDGSFIAMKRSLDDAGLKATDVDYINAHATSTPLGDMYEARAIKRLFGGETPVSSTKSMTGHECWMSGASEVVYSIIMMGGDFIAPNINFEEPDADTVGMNIITEARETRLNVVLSNSFGFGGTNSAIVLRKI